VRYQDGTEGEVDLSHLAGKAVFAAWEQEGVFAKVKLGPHGQIEWPEDMDLCPDALYLRQRTLSRGFSPHNLGIQSTAFGRGLPGGG